MLLFSNLSSWVLVSKMSLPEVGRDDASAELSFAFACGCCGCCRLVPLPPTPNALLCPIPVTWSKSLIAKGNVYRKKYQELIRSNGLTSPSLRGTSASSTMTRTRLSLGLLLLLLCCLPLSYASQIVVNALVVVVYCHWKNFLSPLLAHNMAVQVFINLNIYCDWCSSCTKYLM